MRTLLKTQYAGLGLSNLKLTLIGLCGYAWNTGGIILLPSEVPSTSSVPVPGFIDIGAIFDNHKVGEVIVKLDLALPGAPKASLVEKNLHTGDLITFGTRLLKVACEQQRLIALPLLEAMAGNSNINQHFQNVPLDEIDIALQLRIETDWIKSMSQRARSGWVRKASIAEFDIFSIFRKIRSYLRHDKEVTVYCCVDSRKINQQLSDLRNIGSQHKFRVLFQSDFVEMQDQLNEHVRAAIDFNIAIRCKEYIGCHVSTMTALVFFHRKLAGISCENLIYNSRNNASLGTVDHIF